SGRRIEPGMAKERSGATALGAAAEPLATPARWRRLMGREPWLGQWEFWLALALAALLRLWQLDQSQFLDDQVGLMTLARAAARRGALPLPAPPPPTATLTPPLSIDLLLPTALFTKDPLPAVVLLALWNVAGVGLLYIFTLRYFGRLPA